MHLIPGMQREEDSSSMLQSLALRKRVGLVGWNRIGGGGKTGKREKNSKGKHSDEKGPEVYVHTKGRLKEKEKGDTSKIVFWGKGREGKEGVGTRLAQNGRGDT